MENKRKKISLPSELNLEEHLYTRGLIDPDNLMGSVMKGEKEVASLHNILEDDELLLQVAGVWENDKVAIEAVIAGRIKSLVIELIHTAIPQEVTVIRESIVELVSVLDDFEKAHAQAITRKLEEGKGKPEANAEVVVGATPAGTPVSPTAIP